MGKLETVREKPSREMNLRGGAKSNLVIRTMITKSDKKVLVNITNTKARSAIIINGLTVRIIVPRTCGDKRGRRTTRTKRIEYVKAACHRC